MTGPEHPLGNSGPERHLQSHPCHGALAERAIWNGAASQRSSSSMAKTSSPAVSSLCPRSTRNGHCVFRCYVGWGGPMGERFERHRQPWRADELHKLRVLATKGMALKAIAKALTRSAESAKERPKADGPKISHLRQAPQT